MTERADERKATGGALAGLRVVDLSRVLAGPICTMMLGDNGADVIKVESPDGDPSRHWGPPFLEAADGSGERESVYYSFCNRNKRSVVLDLGTEAGQEICRELVKDADVVVENFKPGALERWGLDYETLKADNPGLIMANISSFGQTGPLAGVPAYDVVGQAMGGMMSITGERDGEPMRVGVAITDITTGYLSFSGILLALAARERTGEGQRLSCSLYESVISLLTHVGANYLMADIKPRRHGNTHPSIVPYQVVQTRDRPMYLAVGTDRQFAALCRALEAPDLGSDSRFATNESRVVHRDELISRLEAILITKDCEEWVGLMRDEGVPAAPILEVPEVLSHPQTEATEMVRTLTHPVFGEIAMTGFPINLELTESRIYRHPPQIGEHTVEVLSEIGRSPAEIEELVQGGVTVAAGEVGQ